MAEQLIRFVRGLQYNGSNGAEVLAQSTAQEIAEYDVHIVSEIGGVLTMGYDDGAGFNSVTYEAGEWVYWPYSWPAKLPEAELIGAYIKRSDLP